MAITEEKARKRRGNYGVPLHASYPVANAVTHLKGGIVVVDDNGRATPAGAGVVGYAAGVALRTYALSTSAGQFSVDVECGVLHFANSSTSPLAAADVGKPCYAEDNDTARKLNGPSGTSYAFLGIVVEVASDGVYVEVNPSLSAQTVKEITRNINQTEGALLPAALTVSFTVGTLPAGSRVIDGPDTDVSANWAGPSITDVKLAIGTAGDDDSILASADIDAATDGRASTRTLGIAPSGRYSGAITGKLTAVGANLSVANAGTAVTRLRYV